MSFSPAPFERARIEIAMNSGVTLRHRRGSDFAARGCRRHSGGDVPGDACNPRGRPPWRGHHRTLPPIRLGVFPYADP